MRFINVASRGGGFVVVIVVRCVEPLTASHEEIPVSVFVFWNEGMVSF